MENKKVAVITGGSGGIGLACCREFSQKGFKVYEISRRDAENGFAVHVKGDVTDERSVAAAFDSVFETEGRLDVLVNNAGFGISGPVEETALADAKKQLDVNFFGCFLCSRAAAGYMRKNGGGRIVNVSSVAAVAPIPFQAFYSASKAAINSLTLSLANELKPFDIKVCAVMPGDVRTGFTDAREKNPGGSAYAETVARSVASMEKDERSGMPPEKIARAVLSSATKRRPRPVRTVGFQYHAVCALIKLLPASFANFVIGKLYT
ncbi:MAG: SDR family oxidoreductase [Clostridia bacterium]|nr:SDR family oxidoreductase [Clostridia bacterium]